MAFSYLYGVRFTGPLTPTIALLRVELYPGGFDRIDWRAHRSSLDEGDTHAAPGPVLDRMYSAAGAFEDVAPKALRKVAVQRLLDRLTREQRTTNLAGISPVNGMLNTLALYHAGADDFEASFAGIDYWIWSDEHVGLRLAGASSHGWDTSFAAQALTAGPAARHCETALTAMGEWLDNAGIPDAEDIDRLPTVGGWCFGDPHHHWPVSDCTAEALVALHDLGDAAPRLTDRRIAAAVRFLLDRHNADGGFGSYEARRGNALLEQLNPSEMFGGCMSEHSYIECTASCAQGLAAVLEHRAGALDPRLEERARRAIKAAGRYLVQAQELSGAWPGVWGIHYTYGTLFAVRGLLAAGFDGDAPEIRRAVDWLLAHRLPDGGWGEHFSGCAERRYVPAGQSHVVQTAWALLTLLEAGPKTPPEHEAVRGGLKLLLSRQQADGGWEREAGAGIFFETAVLRYDLYRLYFPTWALSLAARTGYEV